MQRGNENRGQMFLGFEERFQKIGEIEKEGVESEVKRKIGNWEERSEPEAMQWEEKKKNPRERAASSRRGAFSFIGPFFPFCE